MFKKIGAVALSATILAGGILPSASSAEEVKTTPTSNYVVGQLTQADINLINSNAKNVGSSGVVGPQENIVTAMAKKIAVKALRTSAGYVESALAKVIGANNAAKASRVFYKIANYIERVQDIQEFAIASILIEGGLAPDVAWTTAEWLVLFFGL